jgi:hypothetical protein
MGTSPMIDTAKYWRHRYARGGTSGNGSYGDAADAKAAYVNRFVETHDIESVVDWGCGDGEQLSRMKVANYIGVDVSVDALTKCMRRNPGHTYVLWKPGSEISVAGDLALSLDVVFHFPERAQYVEYIDHVFGSAERYVLFHSTDYNTDAGETARHVRHRQFTSDIEHRYRQWKIVERPEDRFTTGFYVCRRQ